MMLCGKFLPVEYDSIHSPESHGSLRGWQFDRRCDEYGLQMKQACHIGCKRFDINTNFLRAVPAVIARCGGVGILITRLMIRMMIVRRVIMLVSVRLAMMVAGLTAGRFRITVRMVVMPAATADTVPQHRQASQNGQELGKHGRQICAEGTRR